MIYFFHRQGLTACVSFYYYAENLKKLHPGDKLIYCFSVLSKNPACEGNKWA